MKRGAVTFTEATRATFLDFEATASAPHRPALVGIVGHDSPFTQYILDPDLADASRARSHLRVADIGVVLEQLASDLDDRGGVWCSWSTFDLTVVQNSAAPRAVRAVMDRRFRNALDVVPAWAATYGFRPARRRFDTRNQLHRFFEVAGYRPGWTYGSAAPARWIRHVRQRMKRTGGVYPPVSASTKRDWHLLLEYNRHDCVGLRHLVLRATAESERRRAYANTVYSVCAGSRQIRFRIGSKKPALDALVTRLGAREWAHMTAWHPGLVTLDRAVNQSQQVALEKTVRERGFQILSGAGEDPKGRWPAEESIFIVGVRPAEAYELARMFGQWAVVTGKLHEQSRLLWCLHPGPDPNVLTQLPPAVHVEA